MNVVKILEGLASWKSLIILMVLLIVLGFVPACAPEEGYIVISDPSDDYSLDHPFFEEYYGVNYTNNEVIPSALDIVKVRGVPQEDVYLFSFETRGDIEAAFLAHNASIQFGVFIDTDCNGVSDFLISTTSEPGEGVSDFLISATSKPGEGVVVTPEFVEIQRWPLDIEGNRLEMQVCKNLVGDTFDWFAFSGFALPGGAPFLTPIQDLFLTPEVDIACPSSLTMVLCGTSFSLKEEGPLVLLRFGLKCPPPPNTPRDGDAGGPKDSKGNPINDWLLVTRQFGNLTVQMWGISEDPNANEPDGHLAERVFKDTNGNGKQDAGEVGGWVFRCPFSGVSGGNKQQHIDIDDDGTPDIIIVKSNEIKKKDGGTYIMIYKYDVDSNKVTITQKERDAQGKLVDSRSTNPQPPYNDPDDVPITVP